MTIASRQTFDAVIGMWNGSATDDLAALLTPDYRGHMLGVTGGERDGAGYVAAIGRFRAAFPGVSFRVVERFNAGDRVVTRLEARRPGADSPASFESHGINIARFDEQGRLAEEWAIWSPWLDVPEPSIA